MTRLKTHLATVQNQRKKLLEDGDADTLAQNPTVTKPLESLSTYTRLVTSRIFRVATDDLPSELEKLYQRLLNKSPDPSNSGAMDQAFKNYAVGFFNMTRCMNLMKHRALYTILLRVQSSSCGRMPSSSDGNSKTQVCADKSP
jgi:hypothetical protein